MPKDTLRATPVVVLSRPLERSSTYVATVLGAGVTVGVVGAGVTVGDWPGVAPPGPRTLAPHPGALRVYVPKLP